MTATGIHYRRTTAQQRKKLFEKWEETGNISEACRKAHVGRGTFYYWQARFEEKGYKGLEEFEDHAPNRPNRIEEKVARVVIEMKQEHQDWGSYIEVFYNRIRCHSALQYKSPIRFEALSLAA